MFDQLKPKTKTLIRKDKNWLNMSIWKPIPRTSKSYLAVNIQFQNILSTPMYLALCLIVWLASLAPSAKHLRSTLGSHNGGQTHFEDCVSLLSMFSIIQQLHIFTKT